MLPGAKIEAAARAFFPAVGVKDVSGHHS